MNNVHKPGKIENKIDRNISAIHEVRKNSDERRRIDQKFVDHVASFIGSTNSLYLHIFAYGGLNVVHLVDSRPHISTESIGGIASIEAIFLAIFVLINQKGMNALERKNTDLHLQMSLLGEHEVTKLAQLTNLIAKKLDVQTEKVDLGDVLKEVEPTEILNRIAEHERTKSTFSTSDDKL